MTYSRAFVLAILVLGGVVILVLWQLVALNRAPLPRYDEVFFHNVTHQWMETGSYLLSIRPNLYPFEIAFYGPVYFWLQAGMMQALGHGIWEFRLLNAICGLLVLGLVFLFAQRLGVKKEYSLLGILFLLLDPTYSEILHSGRMDLVAVFLALLGIWVLQKHSQRGTALLLGALLFGVSLVTTPRIVFLLPWVLWEVYRNSAGKACMLRGASLLILFLPLGLWVLCKVGIVQYWEIMSHPIIAGHIGADLSVKKTFFRYAYQIPLVILWGASVLHFCWHALQRSRSMPSTLWGVHTSIVLFLLLVAERAPYTAMVMPLMLLVVLAFVNRLLTHKRKRSLRWLFRAISGLVVVQFAIVLGSFVVQLWGESAQWRARSEASFSLPSVDAKRIYSVPLYYHHIVAAGKEFRFADDPTETMPDRAMVLRNKPLQYGDWRDHFPVFTQTYNPVWEPVD